MHGIKCYLLITLPIFRLICALYVPLTNIPVQDTAVWSLATLNRDGTTNMNIMTYAYPVSIRPQPLWALSLYKDTLSYENFIREGWGALQLLSQNHQHVIDLLGNSSGYYKNKIEELKAKGCKLETVDLTLYTRPNKPLYLDLFTDALYCLQVDLGENEITSAGDHDVVLCDVVKVLEPEDKTVLSIPRLTTGYLRQKGLLKS
jgi:flavin reductase (DIM6/NTAB) family NADH-FMN oxidoreductase RutF